MSVANLLHVLTHKLINMWYFT